MFRNWRKSIIKILVGKMPVVMNVTLVLEEPLKASQSDVLLDKSNVYYTDNAIKKIGGETNV